jgi:hypothetical protein
MGVSVGEGDCVAVPLRGGGFGVGVVARANRKGVLLGYFFRPARDHVPGLEIVDRLRPTDAILIGRFGHLGIVGGTWPLIGHLTNWIREDWPVPLFVRTEELSGRSYLVHYDDADPNRVTKEEPVGDPSAWAHEDGLMGAGFAEKLLTRLLS